MTSAEKNMNKYKIWRYINILYYNILYVLYLSFSVGTSAQFTEN